MDDSAIERMRRSLSADDLRVICRIVARCKTGVRERHSPAKVASSRQNGEIARAVIRGDLADADRLRWLYYPEKMRKKEIEAQLGKAPGKP